MSPNLHDSDEGNLDMEGEGEGEGILQYGQEHNGKYESNSAHH